MEELDEWGFPLEKTKYHVGDLIPHIKFGDCKVIEVDKSSDRYIVETQDGTIRYLALSIVDEIPKPPHQPTIVAGQYRQKDGSFNKKEYFFKDRINNGFGGLEIGDIGLAYSHKAKKCVPVKITRIGISSQELKEQGVDRTQMIYINYKGE